MANPQKENGHIDIANEIAEHLAKLLLSPYEWQVLWVIWRKTYGWHKKADKISLSQFVKATGIRKQHIWRALSKLTKRNIVTQIGYKKNITYCFQKDYEKWKRLPKQVTYPKQVTGVTQTGYKSYPKQVTTKETIQKKLLQKKLYCQTSNEVRLSELLLSLIQQRKPDFKKPNIQQWAKVIDRMIRLDKRLPARIEAVIHWCQADNFWQNNILSAEKLRKQFDQLELKQNGRQSTKNRRDISKPPTSQYGKAIEI